MNGFEKRITSAWRALRRHLPPKLAESVRVPSKRLLRRAGMISD